MENELLLSGPYLSRVCVCVNAPQVAVTFVVGSEVGQQSSSDFSQMGKPFLMGTVALGENSPSFFFSHFHFFSSPAYDLRSRLRHEYWRHSMDLPSECQIPSVWAHYKAWEVGVDRGLGLQLRAKRLKPSHGCFVCRTAWARLSLWSHETVPFARGGIRMHVTPSTFSWGHLSNCGSSTSQPRQEQNRMWICYIDESISWFQIILEECRRRRNMIQSPLHSHHPQQCTFKCPLPIKYYVNVHE